MIVEMRSYTEQISNASLDCEKWNDIFTWLTDRFEIPKQVDFKSKLI